MSTYVEFNYSLRYTKHFRNSTATAISDIYATELANRSIFVSAPATFSSTVSSSISNTRRNASAWSSNPSIPFSDKSNARWYQEFQCRWKHYDSVRFWCALSQQKYSILVRPANKMTLHGGGGQIYHTLGERTIAEDFREQLLNNPRTIAEAVRLLVSVNLGIDLDWAIQGSRSAAHHFWKNENEWFLMQKSFLI